MFRSTCFFLVPLTLLALACSAGPENQPSSGGAGGEGGESSSNSGSTSSGMSGSASSSSGSGGSSSTSSSSGSGGNGGGVPSIAFCQEACTTASDCVAAGASGAYDVDNYECNAGVCKYIGCKSDSECATSFPNLGYVCRQTVAGAPAGCVKGCQTANDCDNGGGIAFDADNYACMSGACVYTGCNSDAECMSFAPGYICREPFPGGLPGCYKSCQAGTDCVQGGAQPAFDADNYACTQGFCEYTGCNSDAECQASIPAGQYVCQ